MTSSRLWREFPCCAVLAVAGLFVGAGSVAAQAVRQPYFFTVTETSTDVSPCTGVTGVITHTLTDEGYIVTAGDTFHVVGVLTQDYRTDYPDGTYLISHSPTHYEFNTNSQEFVYTETQQDFGTYYSADGQVIGKQKIVNTFHIVWRDLNGNSQLDPDELIVDSFHDLLRCI
jgi:hypothetical protein